MGRFRRLNVVMTFCIWFRIQFSLKDTSLVRHGTGSKVV
jgi:hypothetical protein